MFNKLLVGALIGTCLLSFSVIGWSAEASSAITPQRYILKEIEIVAKTEGAFGYIVFDTATGVIYKWITVGSYSDNKQITVNQNK